MFFAPVQGAAILGAGDGALLPGPSRVRPQQVRVARAAGIADAVEELEDLDGALAAEVDGVAEGAGFDGAGR